LLFLILTLLIGIRYFTFFAGLVVSIISGDEIISRRYELPDRTIVVVKPNVE